jgi:hypothetical protein
MKNRHILIRFIEPNKKNDFSIAANYPEHILNSKTLRKYFQLIDIDLYLLWKEQKYYDDMYKKIKSYTCKSYKVLIILHGIAVNIDNIHLMFSVRKQRHTLYYSSYHILSFLKALDKPIEIFNIACYGRLGTYINQLPEGSYIIDVSNENGYYDLFINPYYTNKDFQEYLYGNGIDFYKLLALYTLFNHEATNDKTVISTKNKTIDIGEVIKDLQQFTLKDLSNNEFIQHLSNYRIITPAMLKCMHHVSRNKTNYSFYYTLAQYLIEMKEADFPNNIVNKYSKYYYPQQDRKLKFVKINQKLFESYLGYDIKYINPFRLLFEPDDYEYPNDYYECIFKYTPYYSYQKFIVIVNKYIK